MALLRGMALLLAVLGVFVFAATGHADKARIEVVEEERHPSIILVGFKEGLSTMADRVNAHAAVGARRVNTFRHIQTDVVEVPEGRDLDETIAAYQALPQVAYAEPNYKVRPLAIPNDPRYPQLWGMPTISAPDAWDITTGSETVIVAVIDSGVDYNHEDLAGNMWVNPNPTFEDVHGAAFLGGTGQPTSGDPMDSGDHGTHVAGTIGAVGDNEVGVAGVNWEVRIMALKFLAPGVGYTADAIGAIEYAIEHGARMSNNSWGGGGFSQALRNAIAAAGAANQIFVAAAGNDSSDNDVVPAYPASYDLPNIISVASSAQNDNRSGFSNWGATTVHLAAPGSGILSTVPPGNGYAMMSGTSMASPHVAGVAGLLLSLDLEMPHQELKARILERVDRLPQWTPLIATGGRLNAVAALNPFDGLLVLPYEAIVASGPEGGPFDFAKTYTLTNTSDAPLDWTAESGAEWATVAPSGGTLAPGGSVDVEVSLDQSAEELEAGTYQDALTITNTTSGEPRTRNLMLVVRVPLPEAIDQPDWEVTTGGDAEWFGQTEVTFDGVDAAQSGVIGDDQQTWMETVVEGPGTLSFWWRVSSEQGFDFLEFYINGSLRDHISGEVNWHQMTYDLGRGDNTLRWRYMKDFIIDAGQDMGWVDQVHFEPTDAMEVTPETDFLSWGYEGGPFSPPSRTYTLTNTSDEPFDWTAAATQDWLTVSPGNGTLPDGGSVNVVVSINQEIANDLPIALYTDEVTFTNHDTDHSETRAVTLDVRGRPDFFIESIEVNPTTPELGKGVSATVTVRNEGTAPADGGWLDVWWHKPEEAQVGEAGRAWKQVGTLNIGQSRTFEFQFTAPGPPGVKTFRAFVDSENQVAEINEDNNQSTEEYTVIVLPDFVVQSIEVTPGTALLGTPVVATVAVRNVGMVAGDAGWLDVWRDRPASASVGEPGDQQQAVGTLNPGQTELFEFEFDAPGPPGVKTFRAFVDSQGQTAESSEANNQATRSYTVVGIPDFVVDSIELDRDTAGPGETVHATVVVKNEGTASGNAGWLDVWWNRPEDAPVGASGNAWRRVGTLDPQQSRSLEFQFQAAGPSGPKAFRAFVDSKGQTAESDEENNQGTAGYDVQAWSLSILAPEGEGSTSPAPGERHYGLDQDASVEASPAEGWSFSHWLLDGEDAGDDATIQIAAVGDGESRTLQAVFARQSWTLKVLDPEGEGTTDPGTGEHGYNVGVGAVVSATPAEGWRLGRWLVNGQNVGAANPISVPSAAEGEEKTVQAVFVEPGDRVYVKHDAEGAGDGSSWEDAYASLQSGLHAAEEGGEVWVAAGVYRPASDHGLVAGEGEAQERLKHFRMVPGVAIYGGFAGTETELEERDWRANETVLTGDLGVAGDPADNAYHVFYHPEGLDLDDTAVLDGFTITGGNANGVRDERRSGGGMANYGSSPVVANCVFAANSAALGGAMANVESSPEIQSCVFQDNAASQHGGAMRNTGGSSPTVTNSVFTGNSAAQDGGAIHSHDGSWLAVASSTFGGNTAARGRALACDSTGQAQPSAVSLVNSIVWDGPEGIWNNDGSQIAVSHSNVQGGWAGEGNISANPLFVDAAAGNLRLQAGSPSIDAGDDGAVPVGLTVDLDGNPRVAGAAVDMGAYEFQEAWTLTVLPPQGSGQVSPAAGTYAHSVGATPQATATPAEGWRFHQWLLDGVDAGSQPTITVPSGADGDERELQAIFVTQSWTLSILPPDGEGTTDPDLGDHLIEVGVGADVRATPDAGWEFSHWLLDGANAGSENPIEIGTGTDGQTRTLQPVFFAQQWTLTVLPSTGLGTTNPSAGEHVHNVDQDAAVTALPADGWKLGRWMLDGEDVGAANPIIVLPAGEGASKALRAVFVRQTWTLSILPPDGPGTTSPGAREYRFNVSENALVSAVPAEGYDLLRWLLDGADAGDADQILVESGADGQIKELRALFEDRQAPAATLLSPPSDRRDAAPRDALVVVEVSDAGAGVNPATVRIEIGGDLVYDGSAENIPNGFDSTGEEQAVRGVCRRVAVDPDDRHAAYRFRFVRDGDYGFARTIEVRVEASDRAGNHMDTMDLEEGERPRFTTAARPFGAQFRVNDVTGATGRPALASDAAGNLFAAWERDGRVRASRLPAGGTEWSNSVRVPAAGARQSAPAVAALRSRPPAGPENMPLGAQGREVAAIAFEDRRDGEDAVYVAVWGDGEFDPQPPGYLNPQGTQAKAPSAASSEDGRVGWFAWQERNSDEDVWDIVVLEIDTATGNRTRERIADAGADQTQPALASLGGEAWVVWTHTRGDGTSGLRGAAREGGWQAQPVLEDAGSSQSRPALAAGPGPVFHLAWEDDRDGVPGVYYASGSDASFDPAEAVNLVEGDARTAAQRAPAVALANGVVFVAWQDGRHADGPAVYIAEKGAGDDAFGMDTLVKASRASQALPVVATGPSEAPVVIWLDTLDGRSNVKGAGAVGLPEIGRLPVEPGSADDPPVSAAPGQLGPGSPGFNVPRNAVDAPVDIVVREVVNPPPPPPRGIGVPWSFGPSGQEFLVPVTIRIPVTPEDMAGRSAPHRVFWYDETRAAMGEDPWRDDGIADVEFREEAGVIEFTSTPYTLFGAAGSAAADADDATRRSSSSGGGCTMSGSGAGDPSLLWLPLAFLALLAWRDSRRRRAEG